MKKYFPAALLLMAFAACTGGTKPKQQPEQTEAPVPQAVGCAGMAIFQKGKVIQNISRDTSGKITAQSENTIIAVEDQDGVLVSTMQVSSLDETPDTTQYRCDGKVFFVDMISLMGSLKGMTNVVSDHELLEFPLQMNPGDTLRHASLHASFYSGDIHIVLSNELDNRKVESREKVTTAAGTWDCYKISAIMHITSQMQGPRMANNKVMQMKKDLQMIMYFAPEVGMVKMQLFRAGHLMSFSEITAIR